MNIFTVYPLYVYSAPNFYLPLATLLSSDEVTDWVQHAQQLPLDIVNRFEEYKITGYDFPELLENDGALLGSQLGIVQPYAKYRLLRGMRMKLMAMGQAPTPPYAVSAKSSLCSSVLINWKSDSRVAIPVHKYLLQRKSIPHNVASWWGAATPNTTAAPPAARWITVYDGLETHFEDIGLSPGVSYSYRLSAWNLMGRSEYEYFNEITVVAPCNRVLGWRLWDILSYLFVIAERLLQLIFGAIALVTAASRLKHTDGHPPAIIRYINSILDAFIKKLRTYGISIPSYLDHAVGGELHPIDATVNTTTPAGLTSVVSVEGRIITAASTSEQPERVGKKYCSICRGKFSEIDRKIRRHLCSTCNSYFHAECGETSHLFFTPCPVQGSCCCRICHQKKSGIRCVRTRSGNQEIESSRSEDRLASSLASPIPSEAETALNSSFAEGSVAKGRSESGLLDKKISSRISIGSFLNRSPSVS
jgi:hypothetical protein